MYSAETLTFCLKNGWKEAKAVRMKESLNFSANIYCRNIYVSFSYVIKLKHVSLLFNSVHNVTTTEHSCAAPHTDVVRDAQIIV